MATRRAVLRGVIGAALWSPAAVAPAMATATAQALRTIPPSIVVIAPDLAEHVRQRPAVEFDHDRHTVALAPLSCDRCHQLSEAGKLNPRFAPAVGTDRWDERMDAFHNGCIGCHEERSRLALASGPEVCGDCHVRRPEGISSRAAMAFDLSLHGRHAKAYPEKCETCHHVYDPERKVLVHQKGAEAACRTCHLPQVVESTPSRADASHQACVSCHLKLVKADATAGPVVCSGCHEADRIDQIARLEEVPRLLRGQPDRSWVAAGGGQWPAVPFEHLRHESTGTTCSGCHHATFGRCGECHTLRGAAEGAGITLARAFHDPRSAVSCVGCHRQAAAAVECRGCHAGGTGEASERSCTICHSGPPPVAVGESASPPAKLAAVELGGLPESPDDLPEEVVIDGMVNLYEASRLPHGKIVRRLHAAVLGSPLAKRFHGDAEVGCSGCHHHSPVGERPPRCAACHGEVGDPTRDRPDLKAAYHRQCIECHEQMNIKAAGCTDCHAVREVTS